MTKRSDQLNRQLAAAIERQQQTLTQLSAVLTGNVARAGERERLDANLARSVAEYQRLTEELKLAQLEKQEVDGKRRLRHTGRTLREQTLDIVDELGVPMAPGVIAEFADATTGVLIAASRFASLRRDEERAWRRDPQAKPAWVAPALSSASLTAMPRLLTSTAWSAERRIIAPRTLRVNHLRAILSYIRRFELLQLSDVQRAKVLLEGLIWRQSRAVPGATKPGESPDIERIRSTVNGELSLIEPEDEADRKESAARLAKLSPAFQLWGKPILVQGDALPEKRA